MAPGQTSAVSASRNVRKVNECSDFDHDKRPQNSGAERTCSTILPSLIGLKSNTLSSAASCETLISCLTLQELEQTVQAVEASSTAALAITWAILLSAFADAKDDIIANVILPHTASERADAVDGSASSATEICQFSVNDLEHAESSSMLRHFTTSKSAADYPSPSNISHEVQASAQHCISILDLSGLHQYPRTKQNERRFQITNVPENEIRLEVRPTEAGRLLLSIFYIATCLNSRTARLLLRQFDSTLSSLISHLEMPPITASYEANPALLSFSGQCPEINASPDLLQTKFERFSKTEPSRVALEFRFDLRSEGSSSDIVWTYRELNQRGDSFAAYLLGQPGLFNSRIVPICMNRRPELYVTILGILKAGCAWCPIDPTFPSRRRHDLIARTGAAVVVTAQKLLDGIPEDVLPVDIMQLDLDSLTPFESPLTTMEDLAYLVWTSGTTGGAYILCRFSSRISSPAYMAPTLKDADYDLV